MPTAYPLPLPGDPLSDHFKLGALCKNGHDWNGTGLSIRYNRRSGADCVICARSSAPRRQEKARQTGAEWRVKRAEYMRKKRAIEGRPERERLKEQGLTTRGTPRINSGPWRTAIRNAGRSPSVARLVMDEQRRYWRENPEAKREHDKQWRRASWWLRYQIKPDLRLYTRQKSKRRKALMKEQIGIQLTGRQVRSRFEQFGNACAYCGAGGVELHIEHVVPISQGGTHTLGNVIPACQSCNFSKAANQVEAWYRHQPFFCERRWGKIRRVVGWRKAPVGQLTLV